MAAGFCRDLTPPIYSKALLMRTHSAKAKSPLDLKSVLATGARVSEFVNITANAVFFEEQMILISKAEGGKSRYVPILPQLAQELRTRLGHRSTGCLCETVRHTRCSPRRLQQIMKATAAGAGIDTRVYPHLLRHSVATTLLERACRLISSRNSSATPSWRPPGSVPSHQLR